MVTQTQTRRPRPWAIALGLIAVAVVPLLGVAAMAGSGSSDAEGCSDVAAREQAVVKQNVLDVLPGGSFRGVANNSDYDEACALGATETNARWTGTATGADIVLALEQLGWSQVDTGTETPNWLTTNAAPTGAGGNTNDNESPNVVLTKSIGSRDLDVAVDQEGLHVVLARVVTQ